MRCAELVQTVNTYLRRLQMFGGDVVDRNGITILHAEPPYILSYVRADPVVRGPARLGSYRKTASCSRIYRPNSLPRFGLRRCDGRHKLRFEYPSFFGRRVGPARFA
jgi:hypothetical protein